MRKRGIERERERTRESESENERGLLKCWSSKMVGFLSAGS